MKEKILNKEVKIFNQSISTKKILTHPLFSGSFFMIFGSNLANFMAYLYHLILGRILGPSLYGELVATISLIALIMSVISFFGLVIIKFVSSASKSETPIILGWFNGKLIPISLALSLMVWLVSPLIGNFVHLPKNISFLFAPILFFSIISFVYKSFLQGVLKFKETAIVSSVELFSRLLFAIGFVIIGMSVFGATLGILISSVCGLLLTRFFLRNVGFKKGEIEGFNWKSVFSYALPVFLVSITYTSLLTSDLVMVKHFFSSHDAGIYGSISNLGKIIFYGTAPIGAVMFPLISKKKSQNTRYLNIFLLSIILVFVIGIGVLILYYLFPNLAINILYGSQYLEGSKYLILMGIYYVIYSVANLFASFLLSINLTKPVLLLPIFAILQVISISVLHKSLWWVIGSSILSISLLLLYLGIYFAYAKSKTT